MVFVGAALQLGGAAGQPAALHGALLHHALLIPAPLRGLRVLALLGQHSLQAWL